MASEQEPFFGGRGRASSGSGRDEQPLYYDKANHPILRVIIIITCIVVAVFALITVLMASVQAGRKNESYVLLLVSFLAILQVLPFTLFFVYKEYLPKNCIWAVFFFAAAIVIESIFTDVLVFSYDVSEGEQ